MTHSHHTTHPVLARILSIPYALVQNDLGGRILGWVIRRAPFMLPVKRIHETDSLLVFHHPRPGYPFHALFLPKRYCPSLMDFSPQEDAFVEDTIRIVQQCVEDFQLEKQGYRLIINGGRAQDAAILHAHLIGESDD